MATGLQKWSTTAASNNSADSSVNWAEGQAPSSVNDSARAMMASGAKWRDDNSGTLSTTGSSAAFTVTSNQVSTGNVDGYTVAVKFHAATDAAATLSQDGNTAAVLQVEAGTNLVGGEYAAGSIQRFTYSSGSTAWVANGGGKVQTAKIANSAVTLAKIANQATNTILGNTSGSDGPPVAITLGTGLSVASAASTAPTLSAPAFPPTGAFKNLSIKVASNTTVTGAADFATLATNASTSFITLPLSGTINFGTSGSSNALDTGSVASGTWYAIWGIAASSTSTGGGFLASTSFTTPAMPSGFTYKSRLGAVVTSTSTASAQLMGTWQYGRKAQYVVGLAQTATVPVMIHGLSGDVTIPTFTAQSVDKFVPTTASAINATLAVNAAGAVAAPNSSYGVAGSVTNPAPLAANTSNYAQVTALLILESRNIYYAANGSGAALACSGWDDNI